MKTCIICNKEFMQRPSQKNQRTCGAMPCQRAKDAFDARVRRGTIKIPDRFEGCTGPFEFISKYPTKLGDLYAG